MIAGDFPLVTMSSEMFTAVFMYVLAQYDLILFEVMIFMIVISVQIETTSV